MVSSPIVKTQDLSGLNSSITCEYIPIERTTQGIEQLKLLFLVKMLYVTSAIVFIKLEHLFP